MRLAAKDRSRSGRLISRAITTEPTSVASSAMPTQTNQVPLVNGPAWAVSVCSQ